MLFDILSHSLCFSLYIYNFVILLNHLYNQMSDILTLHINTLVCSSSE